LTFGKGENVGSRRYRQERAGAALVVLSSSFDNRGGGMR
jgi:hypothetical protein